MFEGLAISNQRVKTRKITEIPSRRFIVSDRGSFLRFKLTQIYCPTVDEESSIPLVELGKSGSALSCRYEESALQKRPDALVGVEVAVHTDCVFIDGRIAAGPQRVDIEKIVRDVDRAAGYGGSWNPDPGKIRVTTDLSQEALSAAEFDIRPFSDDQNIIIGYACGDEQINYWPAAHSVSGELGRRLLKKYLTANEAVRGAQPMSGGHRVTEEIDFMRV